MNIVHCLSEWQALRPSFSGSVAFVPTIGALPEGHFSLIRPSVANNHVPLFSIYAIATHFHVPAVLAIYPITLEAVLSAA